MQILRNNSVFFAAFVLWLLAGALWLATHETGEDILFWNERRSAFGDFFFKWITLLGEGWAYGAVIIGLLFYKRRYSLLVLAMGLTAMLVSYLSKQVFSQERPLAFLRNMDQVDMIFFVDGVKVHSGATSFPSGHTMGAFALFALLAFLVKDKKWAAVAFFLLALAVGISRIYLVQHFMKDVYAGSIIGVGLAVAAYAAFYTFRVGKQQPI
jgi:membrane-associated phospholipid phosphatase